MTKMEYAYGCFLGLLCGDAAGATLEFYRGQLTDAKVQKAMTMPGGGQLGVGPGQVTDDSELALSLATALLEKNPRHGFPLEDVAGNYVRWFESRPFDIGGTCAKSFSVQSSGNIANMMMRQAQESIVSEANGALMRVAPLAIWCHTEPVNVIAQYAKLDALLSHPSDVCQECNVVFVVALAHLITHPGDYAGTISYLDEYVEYHIHSPIVKNWYFNDSKNIDTLNCKSNIGHVRWAFTLAIHFLRQNESYESAIFKTLMKGGDTDTNAAIVGAMMGALHGSNKIPLSMKDPVLKFDVTNKNNGGYERPSVYNATNVYPICHYLLNHQPTAHHRQRN